LFCWVISGSVAGVISSSRGSLFRLGLLAVLWGSSFLWIKMALHGFSPVQMSVIRAILGAGLLVAVCLIGRQRLPRGRRIWGHLVIAAIFGNVLPYILFPFGEQTVDSGVAGVLNATTPLWALLIGIVIGTDRGLSPVRLGGLLLGFAGTLLIFAPWQASGLASWGTLAILSAAFSYAICYAYVGRFVSARDGSPLALSAAQLTVASGLGLLVVPVGGLQTVHFAPGALIALAILGLLGTGLAYAINYRLIADEGATNATTVGYLLPVVSVLLGAAFLGEGLNLRVIAGMLVVLVGVGMTRWQRSPGAGAGEPDRAGGDRVPAGRPALPVVADLDHQVGGADRDGRGVHPAAPAGELVDDELADVRLDVLEPVGDVVEESRRGVG
jgi:drug/metabolite transporter (DMT)-like permease